MKGGKSRNYIGIKYLELLSDHKTINEEISNRLGQTRNCIRQPKPVLWDSHLARGTERRIYDVVLSCVVFSRNEAKIGL